MSRLRRPWLLLSSITTGCAIALTTIGTGHAYASSHGGDASNKAGEEEVSRSEMCGIEMGEFSIRSDYPAEAQKSTIRFTLYAAVKSDRLASTNRIVDEHRQKLRDEVITATRLTPLGVFEEPDLKTFRRRILIRLRRTIPEFVVEELYVSDFGLLVKSL